jgi:hypothetical protein
MDQSSELDIKDFVGSIFYPYKKMPTHLISSGGSGYRSVYLIGDASAPVINMHWSDTSKASGRKILIIGNTLAELFGKSLGDAVVIEIQISNIVEIMLLYQSIAVVKIAVEERRGSRERR